MSRRSSAFAASSALASVPFSEAQPAQAFDQLGAVALLQLFLVLLA